MTRAASKPASGCWRIRPRLNGYKAPARVEMTGYAGQRARPAAGVGHAQEHADLNRLTLEELREYRRLEAKALGAPDVTEIEAVKAPEVPDEAAELAKPKTDKSKEND